MYHLVLCAAIAMAVYFLSMLWTASRWGFKPWLVNLQILSMFTRLILLSFYCNAIVSKSAKVKYLAGNLVRTCHFPLVLPFGNRLLTDWGKCLPYWVSIVLCDHSPSSLILEPNLYTLRDFIIGWLWRVGLCFPNPCCQLPCRSPGYVDYLGNIYIHLSSSPSMLTSSHQRDMCILYLMMFAVFVSAAGADCWLFWEIPSYLLSLSLIVPFTLDMEHLVSYLCWYLDVRVNRDEVKGIHPLAYEDDFSEALLAIFLFLVHFSVVCWQGVRRLVWFQSCGTERQLVRVYSQIHDLQTSNWELGSLRITGLFFQCLFRMMLHLMYYRDSPRVYYVLVIWTYLHCMDMRILYFVNIAHLSGVLGPCRTAPDRQLHLPRNAIWIINQDRSSIEIHLYLLSSLYFIASPFDNNLACMAIWSMLYVHVLNIIAK